MAEDLEQQLKAAREQGQLRAAQSKVKDLHHCIDQQEMELQQLRRSLEAKQHAEELLKAELKMTSTMHKALRPSKIGGVRHGWAGTLEGRPAGRHLSALHPQTSSLLPYDSRCARRHPHLRLASAMVCTLTLTQLQPATASLTFGYRQSSSGGRPRRKRRGDRRSRSPIRSRTHDFICAVGVCVCGQKRRQRARHCCRLAINLLTCPGSHMDGSIDGWVDG